MFKYAALLEEKRISILGRLYFIVFMWESGLACVYLHQSTVPLINKPLPYQNFQSTLPMGNTLFASPVFSEKVNQAKIGCNYFFILFFGGERLLGVCACAVWMCLSTSSLLSSAPLPRKTTFCAFFFSLLQLYKHIVKEQMSFFFFWQSSAWASQTSVISRSKFWTDHKCVFVSDSFSLRRRSHSFLSAAFRAGSGATCCRLTQLKESSLGNYWRNKQVFRKYSSSCNDVRISGLYEGHYRTLEMNPLQRFRRRE